MQYVRTKLYTILYKAKGTTNQTLTTMARVLNIPMGKSNNLIISDNLYIA
jgi:hypothetical protein